MTRLNSQLQLSILNRKKSKNLAEKGFTLIELLITVVILGVLSSIAVPGFIAQKNKADIQAANAQGKALMSACKVGLGDGSNVNTNFFGTKQFGNVTWVGAVTQATANAAPTACSSSTTAGATSNQSFIMDIATGDLSTDTPAS